MSNIDLNLIWGPVVALPIFLLILSWQLRLFRRHPTIDSNGLASRRYPLDQWEIVGYFETGRANEVDKAVVRKALKVRADVIAYERSGLWVYFKRLPQ